MNVTRMAVLGVALVAGVGAFFLMMGNGGVDQAVQIVEQPRQKTARVMVADRNLERGERLNVENIKWTNWPEKSLSPLFITEDSITDPEELAGAVARTSFVEGEPIIENKIVRAGSSSLLAAILSPGMRAVTMRVSPETASGGFILPGDRVDIMHTGDGRNGTSRTRTLFENVRVLAVNTIYSETPETPHIEGVNVTLEFSPEDSEAFLTARSEGALNLVLRSVFVPDGDVKSQTRKSSDVNIIRYGRS